MILKLQKEIIKGYLATKEDAMKLLTQDISLLTSAANQIRETFCQNTFDLCTIINGKNGLCSEDCKYCAQSSHYPVNQTPYPLLDSDSLLHHAHTSQQAGILRYSIVTSGKKLTDTELDHLCASYKKITQNCTITLCASHGLLTVDQFQKLKAAGVTRIHNNLETSRRFFPQICTTHTYEDKINTIKAAQKVGLSVCSGGIIGLGESMEDRIDMLLELRDLGIKSVPVNLFCPIPGTPLEQLPPLPIQEIYQTIAIFRFLLPDGAIRLAGGRNLLPDKGTKAFCSGANAAITGDLLTTTGSTVAEDIKQLHTLGFQIRPL